MELLKLEPAYKDYLWGGKKLIQDYNKQTSLNRVAETWELSNHKDGSCKIINGKYNGVLFRDYLAKKGKTVWGKNCINNKNFPLMVKFIDAKQTLSIQVHPDDTYAYKHEGENGKNEFWYVLEAEPDAYLYYGVNKQLTKQQFKEYILNGTICDYLKKVPVKKGDCFFIKAGIIHAIGAGILIAEIQQCSNSTYRVYDFGRLDDQGKARELHIDKAIDVASLIPSKIDEHKVYDVENRKEFNKSVLTSNDYFTCEKYDVIESFVSEVSYDTFEIINVIDGCGKISFLSGEENLRKGDTIFIPAQNGTYQVSGSISFLRTFVEK